MIQNQFVKTTHFLNLFLHSPKKFNIVAEDTRIVEFADLLVPGQIVKFLNIIVQILLLMIQKIITK